MSMEIRRRGLTIILVLIVTVLIGCTSSQGFDRTAINEALHIDLDRNEDQPPANPASNLSLPFRLGVFFANHDIPTGQSIRKVEWLVADRDQLLRLLTTLQDERILTDTVVLMDATLRGENILGIRQSGARYGADVVLIVEGAAAVDRYNNAYARFYPTLIGAYFAPGTESGALVALTGSLWGIQSEWHPPTQAVEGVAKSVGPAVFVEDDGVVAQAKEAAIEALGKRIIDQLRLLKEELPRAKLPSQ
ncbi:MAG: hypothetical protein P0120_06590 [Nitrospira sp.]|nr:hypothetical protein [Nitrospira sp.]